MAPVPLRDEASESLPDDVVPFGGHYYKVFKDRLSWPEAKRRCEDMGGSLACVTSLEELKFLWKLANRDHAPDGTCCWVGATDEERETEWTWLSGEPFGLRKVLVAEGGLAENCLNLRVRSGLLEDFPSAGEQVGPQWFVCEWTTPPRMVRLTEVAPLEKEVGFGRYLVNERGPNNEWPMIPEDYRFCDEYLYAFAPSRLVYAIPPQARSFSAVAYSPSEFCMQYEVIADGRTVYQQGGLGVNAVQVDLPEGAKSLELRIGNPIGEQYGWTYWLFPRFHAERASSVRQLDGNEPHVKLTELKPLSAEAGCGGLRVNEHGGTAGPLHLVRPELCPEFIFAHATSRVVFPLPEGAFEFSAIGYCMSSQEVQYVVRVDGRTVFESPQAGIVPINVALPKESKQIELVVEGLTNGFCDHSFWCYPRVSCSPDDKAR